ncbi:sulfotransferase family 2 domain-containing protein [Maricaulis sp.]|mgnify:FL=1|uniref:sulfotransferase family 2 domain-containing protein n=1 Tax=Maricaulis sp. TaxID=1486257 RepID=UPI003A907DC5|tara:strand:- start:9693 stop:10388 length:696 start_codon:yes stop_codon:yes gene_type:complete
MSADRDYLYLFNHIPKTAGTAFKKSLLRNVGEERFLDIIHPDKAKIDETLAVTNTRDLTWICANFHNKQIESLRNTDGRALRIVTMLRHPVQRGMSLYRFVRNKKSHALYGRISKMDLLEFARDDALDRQLSEYYTRRFGGGSFDDAVALLNRDKLVVGVTEEMSSTMRVIARVTGFSDLDVPHANVSKQFSEFNVDEDRVAEATRILAEKNPLDIRLYDHFRDVLLETGV